MNKKDLKNLKDSSLKDLINIVEKNKLKLGEEIAEFYGKSDNNPKKIRKLKKDIAQIKTIIRQKEIEEAYSEQEEKKDKISNKK